MKDFKVGQEVVAVDLPEEDIYGRGSGVGVVEEVGEVVRVSFSSGTCTVGRKLAERLFEEVIK